MEAKFGLRIRDSKPSDTGARGHSDPMDVDAVNSLSLSSATGQSYGRGKQSKSWSQSEGKGKSKENKRTKVPKAYIRAKHRKLVSQVLKTRNRRQARTFRNLHRHTPLTLPGTMVGMVTNGTMAGVSMNGMMTGVLLDGTKVGNKRVTLPQAHSHLEVWMSVPPVVRSALNG